MMLRMQQHLYGAQTLPRNGVPEPDVFVLNSRDAHLITYCANQLRRAFHGWYTSRMPAFAFIRAAVLSAALAPAIVSAQAAPGDASFRSGDFTQAGRAYGAAVARNPKDVGALIGLARVQLYGNGLDAASATARRVLAFDAQNADAARILRTIGLRRHLFEEGDRVSVPDGGAVLPFVEAEPLPMIELTIDGHPANCVLDTGAPDVVIDPDFAAQAGIAVTGGQVGTFAGGRTATVRQATLQRVQAGPIELHNVTAGVLPSRGISFYRDRRVDCTVGTGFLMRFLATIDYPHKRLVLRRRTDEIGKAPEGVSMTMWLVGDHFIFAGGSVNGVGGQLFLVDSGLAGGGFGPEKETIDAAHVRTFPNRAGQGIGGGGAVTFIPVVADELCLGSACQRDIQGVYTPSGSPLAMFPFRSAGTISHTYLEHYAVTFDFVRMQLTLN